MNWQDYIVIDKEILVGKPTIKGTRLSVEFVLGLLASGWSQEQLLENYPNLTKNYLSWLSGQIPKRGEVQTMGNIGTQTLYYRRICNQL